MVYESRVGDVFALGATSWRIEDITHDRVLVSPAPGQPGRLPFWKGDQLGRPAELGAAIGAFTRELSALGQRRGQAALHRRRASTTWAAGNLVAFLDEQREATSDAADRPDGAGRAVPRRARRLADRDPLALRRAGARTVGAGDRGAAARALRHRRAGAARRRRHRAARPRDRPGPARRRRRRVRPRRDRGHRHHARSAARRCSRPGSASARPGRCCCPAATPAAARRCGSSGSAAPSCSRSRSSTRPSRSCSRRSASASRTSTTSRRCSGLMRDLVLAQDPGRRGRDHAALAVRAVAAVRLRRGVHVRRRLPRRRAARRGALASTRACSPSCSAGPSCASCSTPTCSAELERELQRLTPDRQARDAEGVADLLRLLGPLSTGRGRGPVPSTGPTPPPGWRCSPTPAGSSRCGWAARTAGPRSRTSPGSATRSACPCRRARPRCSPSPSRTRWPTWWPGSPARTARSRPPTSPQRLGLGVAVAAADAVPARRAGPGARGRVPAGRRGRRVVRRRGAAPAAAPLAGRAAQGGRAGRAGDPGPVPAGVAERHVGGARRGRGLRGVDGVLTVVDQLAGCAVPASALEPLVLGSRVVDYRPSMLDELTASGEVLWAGHGTLPGTDGWVSLHLADTAHLTLPDHAELDTTPLHDAVRRGARRRRRVLLPAALHHGRVHRRQGARGGAVGPGVGAAGSATTPSRRCGR